MKIQMVPMSTNKPVASTAAAEFVMVEVSGPLDPQNAVLLSAQALIRSRGSKAMVESFEAAIKNSFDPHVVGEFRLK
jgi:hypothetical protein